jgi:hypothetical protein
MGLIEVLLERVSITSALLGTVALYIIYNVYVNIDKSIRLKRLPGVPAPKVKTKLPLGMYPYEYFYPDLILTQASQPSTSSGRSSRRP